MTRRLEIYLKRFIKIALRLLSIASFAAVSLLAGFHSEAVKSGGASALTTTFAINHALADAPQSDGGQPISDSGDCGSGDDDCS